MVERARELALTDGLEAAEQEAVAHRADDAVVAVDRVGGAEHQPELALHNSVRPPSVPRCRVHAAVIDFPQGREGFGLLSGRMFRIEPKSFRIRRPELPTWRSRPPLAPVGLLSLGRAG